MDDPSTALFAGQTTAEAPTSAAASKQVLVMQEGGSVGDCESKLVMKGAREDSVLGATSSLPAQQGQPDSKPPPPKKEQIEGATRPEGSKGGESEAKPASLGTADGGQKASGSKRERDEPQSNAESMAPQAAPPAFLKSLKAAADSAAVIQPPESKRGKVNASSQVADTILAVPTPNPYKPSSAGPPSSEQAKEVVALPVASPAVLTKPTGETGGQEADQKKAAERAAESGPEQQGTETGLHRELSFAVKQSGPGATEVQVGAAESNSQAILPVPVSAIAELTPPTPQVMAALKDNLEVRPRQTRSRTMEKSDGLGSKERAGGAGIVPGVLPKGKRSASNRKKSRFLSGGEDSSAAEDAGVSSDDTERTVSADGAGSEEGTQKLQPGEHGCVAGANISGEDEAGSSPSKVGGSGASEYKQGAAEGVPADQENVEQLATTSALREDPNGAAKEAGVAAQASPEAPEPSLKAIAPESARHASPPRSTVLPQLKGVRSPRKGLRRGQETPPKAPANAAPPPGGAKQQNTEEDVAQLLVELSEGRTPEKVKRRLIGEEATPTSGLERKRVAVESVPAATEGVEGAAAGSGRTNQVAKAVKVEAASADVQIVSGAAVSCEQGATPRSVAFQEAKNGTSSPGEPTRSLSNS